MAVLPTGFCKTIFYESFVILKESIIVPCRIITEDQIRSNNYLWVVAFKKKGNLLKDMASNKY